MRLVVDASAGLYVAASAGGFTTLAGHELVAPALFWSEATSSLREAVYRGAITADAGQRTLEAILVAPIDRASDPDQYRQAPAIAARLGWAKTYDAEYLAVARQFGLPLLTQDARLARGAAGLVDLIPPEALLR